MGRIDTYPDQTSSAPFSGSTLGYAEVTASQAGIGTGNTDLTGLSVTITVPAGRRIRISAQGLFSQQTSLGHHFLFIQEGATQLEEALVTSRAVGDYTTLKTASVVSPSAGTHTYKLQAKTSAGTSTLEATGTYPAFILVEDITGNQNIAPSLSVPVGVLAQVYPSQTQTAITTEVALTGYTANVTVPAGRLLKITVRGGAFTSTTGANHSAQALLKEDGVSIASHTMVKILDASVNAMYEFICLRSPTAGTHTYTVTFQRLAGTDTLTHRVGGTENGSLVVEDITPTPAPATGAPSSTLGYAETLANTATFTTVELPILSVNITVPVGRRLKISGAATPQSTVAGDVATFRLYEDGVQVEAAQVQIVTANQNQSVQVRVVRSPTAGAHTYELRAVRIAGTGTWFGSAGATGPTFLLVEDITGAVWPAGSAITAGMVASEAWIDFAPGITLTNITVGNGTVLAKYTRIGRTIHYRFKFVMGSTSAMGTGPRFSFPVTPNSEYNAESAPMGIAQMIDAGVSDYQGTVIMTSGAGRIARIGGSGSASVNITATAPFTWGTGDVLEANGTYEAAS